MREHLNLWLFVGGGVLDAPQEPYLFPNTPFW